MNLYIDLVNYVDNYRCILSLIYMVNYVDRKTFITGVLQGLINLYNYVDRKKKVITGDFF